MPLEFAAFPLPQPHSNCIADAFSIPQVLASIDERRILNELFGKFCTIPGSIHWLPRPPAPREADEIPARPQRRQRGDCKLSFSTFLR